MAIDDNTSYELTGAQVKDLANKIKAKAADNIFVGATSALPGSKGLVPQPQAGDDTKFLSGDGTWKTVSGGGSSATKIYTSYYNGAGYNYTFYKDSARTTTMTYQELINALQSGGVEWHEDDQGVPNIHYISSSEVDSTSDPDGIKIAMEFNREYSSTRIRFATTAPNGSLSSSAALYALEFNYSLPTASANTLGGVKVGNNLSISSGVLSASDALIIREWS